ASDGNNAKSGYSVLSVVPSDLGDIPVLSTSYEMNGEAVKEAEQGDIASLTLYWEAAPNSIYLVYVDESGSTSVIEKNGLVKRKGYCEYVTDQGAATISFKVGSYGDHVTPTVYIVDLTTGKVVGRSDDNGLKVNK
ncbi:MAG: hypothetical protein IIY02_00230, partial [Firmicutes bacterium]|nr:hypothetical protein [Bacillota bacterium]